MPPSENDAPFSLKIQQALDIHYVKVRPFLALLVSSSVAASWAQTRYLISTIAGSDATGDDGPAAQALRISASGPGLERNRAVIGYAEWWNLRLIADTLPIEPSCSSDRLPEPFLHCILRLPRLSEADQQSAMPAASVPLAVRRATRAQGNEETSSAHGRRPAGLVLSPHRDH